MNFGVRKSVDVNKLGKKVKCEICEMDFVGCQDPNLPVQNPCGCFFHEYCLYTFGGRNSYCPGSSCHRAASGSSKPFASSGRTKSSVMRSESSVRSKSSVRSESSVRATSSGSSGCKDCKDLRRENKQLTSENTKLNKKVEQLSEKAVNSEDLRKENKKLTSEISKLKKKIDQLSQLSSKSSK